MKFNFFRKKKRNSSNYFEQRKKEYQSIKSERNNEDKSRYEQVLDYRKKLNFIGRRMPISVVQKYYEVGTFIVKNKKKDKKSIKKNKKNTKGTYRKAIKLPENYQPGNNIKEVNSIFIFMLLNAFIASFVVLLMALLVFHANLIVLATSFIVTLLIVYGLFYLELHKRYVLISTLKQQNFNSFVDLIIPYLKTIKSGNHMYSILEKVNDRINDKVTQALISRLMARIAQNPGSELPFMSFSRDMSDSDFSDLFMSSVYRMSVGASRTTTVESLAEKNDAEYMEILDGITTAKEKQMQFIYFAMFILAILTIMSFTLTVVMLMVGKAVSVL
ncbi:hypothetical protein [Apilactobacillus timberlakei]|uniref:hypothetical protein n=1 Tax=Apilactobacillus timberlakei TaxID=2008380 RepID=UPI0011277658|nr:hypothetical protein [Apilactobacillus timberlakei]TPR16736.1 hypothetical protein DYZ95_07080 [Apilactobacillus timberlakei]TPR21499.1 hypothetical protein DY083_05630 [Apilactobacillus timberlakei]